MPFRTAGFRSSWLESVGTFLDDVLEPFAPKLSNRRRAARSQKRIIARRETMLMQAFDAGRDDKLRGDKWLKSGLSADSALDQELATLRRNSNEIYRTCGFGTAAIENRTNNVVGSGIRPQARVLSNKTIGLDKQRATRINRQLESLYEQVSPHIGAGGKESLWQIQRLAQRCWLRDGEVFIVFSDVARDTKPIPLQVNLVDAARVSTPTVGAIVKNAEGGSFKFSDPTERVLLGISKDPDGEIRSYYVRDQQPGDTQHPEETWTRFPADRVCHLFEKLWIDQRRGLPWLFSVINLVKDFKDFREAVLVSANVAACMTAIISGGNPTQIKENTVDEHGRVKMESGSFLFVGDDAQISNFNPSQPTSSIEVFNRELLVEMAAAICEPYGWLTGNRKGQTYSAGKLDEIEGRVPVEVQQKTHADIWLFDLWLRLVQQAVLFTELVEITPAEWLAKKHHFSRHVWRGPGRPFLDPAKEIPALIQAKKENLLTLSDIHARQGLDTEEVLRQRGRENRLEEQFGCVPPNQNNQAVERQPQPLPEDDDDEPLDEDE